MSGIRLAVGLVAMGGVVPLVVLYLLNTLSPSAWLSVAAPCFFGWCIAELIANILARPRLENRSPGDALRAWEPDADNPASGRASSDR